MSIVCVENVTLALRLSWGEGEGDLLEVGAECVEAPGMWLSGPLTPPAFISRDEEAPPSSWVPGDLTLSQVKGAGVITGNLAVTGTTLAGVLAQQTAWENAIWRRTLTASIIVDREGETPVTLGSWAAKGSTPAWGPITPDRLATLTAQTPILIPVNPPGSP